MADNTMAPATEEEELFYNQYTFTCSGQGAESGESDLLKVIPPGVPIHFMRYGLIKEDASDLFTYPRNKKPTWQKVDGAPDIPGFKYVRTSLREGLVYVYNERTGKINQFDTDSMPINPFVLKKDDTIWVAYSEVSWKKEFAEGMCGDAAKRSRRMQKISWDDWYNKQQIVDGTNVEQVDGVFLNNYEAYNFGRRHESVFANEEEPERKENLFFCLHDPLAIADELTMVLNQLWHEMEGTIISAQTGLTKQEVVEALQEGKMPDDIARMQNTKEREQVEALFKTALLLYQHVMAYDKTEGKKKIKAYNHKEGSEFVVGHEKHLADYLDKDRVRKLLAKNERDDLKNRIQNSKDNLTVFLKSAYYLDRLLDYTEGDEEEIARGKIRVCFHFRQLQYRPNAKDKLLETKEENDSWTEKPDNGKDYFNYVTQGNEAAGKLLAKKTVIEVIDTETAAKFVAFLNGIFGALAEVSLNDPVKRKEFLTIINSIQIKVNGKAFSEFFEEVELSAVFRNPPTIEDSKKMLNLTQEVFNQRAYFLGAGISIKQLKVTAKVEREFQRTNGAIELAKFLQNSTQWNRLIAGVSYLNFGLAVGALPNTKGDLDRNKNILKLVGSVAEIASSHATLHTLRKRALGFSDELLMKPIFLGKAFGAGAAFIGAAVDLIDAGINISEGDEDAAFAYTASAVCGVLMGVGAFSSWNPVGWISLIVAGFGFAFLALYLEDTPFEQFVKNNLLVKPRGFFPGLNQIDTKGMNYYDCIQYHLKNREKEKLADLNLKSDWKDFTKLYESMTDMVYAGKVSMEPKRKSKIEAGFGYSNTVFRTISYNVTLILPQFIEDYSELEQEMYIFPQGLAGGGPKIICPVSFCGKNYEVETKENEPTKLQLHFSLPELYHNFDTCKKAEVVFLFRAHVNEMHVYPIERGGVARFMAIKEPIEKIIMTTYSGSMGGGASSNIMANLFFSGSKIRTGTKRELLSHNFWMKKEEA